jgi:SIT4-associating protein SAP185/190
MFWRFGGYANISTIDTLLDKSDVTLEELLDESDLIQELKQHNTKLIEFLRDENTLQRLLKYVVAPGPATKDGDEDDDETVAIGKGKGKDLTIRTSPDTEKSDEEQDKAEKLRLKYAYVACEVLSSETWSILEALMANILHLQEFWDFLRRPPPLDPLQAGYFTKVNETLLEKKTEEMLDFFKSSPGIIQAMLQHVDCPMVMDLLLKIISLEKAEGGQGIVDVSRALSRIFLYLAELMTVAAVTRTDPDPSLLSFP